MNEESPNASGSEPASVKPVRPRAGLRLYLRALKWIGTALCLALIGAFLFSMRRAVMWDSADSQHSFVFGAGEICFGWRWQGWRPEAGKSLPTPGWSVAGYGPGNPDFPWWPRRDANEAWESFSVPVWMPLLLVAGLTVRLWHRDRAGIRESIERWKLRLCPSRRLRLTVRRVAVLAVLHFVCVLSALLFIVMPIWDFFMYPREDGLSPSFSTVTDWVRPLLIWAAPAWGLLWAWAYVRLRNHLFDKQPVRHCRECGYNLTGNTSGVCPECGVSIAKSVSTATAAT